MADSTDRVFAPLDERATAFHECLGFMQQRYPNMALMTYDHRPEATGFDYILLSKIVPGVERDGTVVWSPDAVESTADNVPGGLVGECTLGGARLRTEFYPLIVGREPVGLEGLACVRFTGDVPVHVRFGGYGKPFMHKTPVPELSGDAIDTAGCTARAAGQAVVLATDQHPIVVAARASGPVSVVDGTYAESRLGDRDGWLLLSFATDPARALELLDADVAEELERHRTYYETLLAGWSLDTPNSQLNEAFTHALLNVEYAWLRPLGWIESIQHWPTMWHMEQTHLENWAGHADRTRECLRTLATHLLPSGAVPDMNPDGSTRRDWGGSNPYFFREVGHYLGLTGDVGFMRELEPALERVLAQTFEEYDPQGAGVLAFGSQIGNQEDFEATPGPGAAPGSEGVVMLRIMAQVKDALGKPAEAHTLRRRADWCLAELKRRCWLADLGRFAWYEDRRGYVRPDGAYHAQVYPLIYGLLDSVDARSAADHLLHRLTGPEGEIYQSNHFADHDYWGWPTWGMQAGSDMQPFATLAYAAAGLNDAAIRPLEFVASRVCSSYNRGSWPETANEARFAYFSPSAGVFAQAMIEGIFGLHPDAVGGRLLVTPSFPSDWDHAALKVPGYAVEYRREGHRISLDIASDREYDVTIRYRTAPYSRVVATVDGAACLPKTLPECGWFEAEVQCGRSNHVVVEVDATPLEYEVVYPATATGGDTLPITVSGAQVVGVEDRCGVFASVGVPGPHGVEARIADRLLTAYEKYGNLGLINFARRTFALRLRAGETEFTHPCAVTVVPRFQAEAIYAAGGVSVTLRNASGDPIAGPCGLRVGDVTVTADVDVPARSETVVRFTLPRSALLSAGDNQAYLYLPGGEAALPLTIDAGPQDAVTKVLPLPDGTPFGRDKSAARDFDVQHRHMMSGVSQFMSGLFEAGVVEVGDGTSIVIDPRGFAPVNHDHQPVWDLPMGGLRAKKLYIGLLAFIDNHAMYSESLRVEAICERGEAFLEPLYRRDLCFPGDLDMAYPGNVCTGFHTYRPRQQRFALPGLGETDYLNAQPPVFPDPVMWSRSRAVEVGNAIVTIVEFDLGRFQPIRTLRFSALAAEAAFGILGVTAQVG